MADLKAMLGRVSPDDVKYGLHGLRVTGYNLSIAANGEDVTVAHGLWTQGAHSRYARFSLRTIFGMAARMMSGASRDDGEGHGDGEEARDADSAAVAPREITRGPVVRYPSPAVRSAVLAREASPPRTQSPGGDGVLPHVSLAQRLLGGVVRPAPTPAITRSAAVAAERSE